MYRVTIPSPGFGTFRLEGETLKQSVQDALSAGYRHIDTAQIYGNERQVGEAIQNSSISRDNIFLTTKVWFNNLREDKFLSSVEQSLERLKTDYVDLLLIHWPSPKDEVAMESYLKLLSDCVTKSHARAIGVSNFTPALLERAFSVIGKNNIAVNQVEVHPHFQNNDVVNYCQRNGIAVVGYMPLGKGKVMQDAQLLKIAKTHDVTPASIALAWQFQRGIVPIPASTNSEHIKANFNASKIRLSKEELETISSLDSTERLIDPDFSPDW